LSVPTMCAWKKEKEFSFAVANVKGMNWYTQKMSPQRERRRLLPSPLLPRNWYRQLKDLPPAKPKRQHWRRVNSPTSQSSAHAGKDGTR
jgi:hypothetical protein